jgi:transcriptional regulator of heat shock response
MKLTKLQQLVINCDTASGFRLFILEALSIERDRDNWERTAQILLREVAELENDIQDAITYIQPLEGYYDLAVKEINNEQNKTC